MSYHNVLFFAELESLETRRNNFSRSFFRDICKPTSCLHHLIPPARDTSVTRLRLPYFIISLPRPNLRTKKYCSFINFGLDPLPTNTVIPNLLYTSLPAPMYIYETLFVSFVVFIYYFNCISFAIRLSGRKVARLLRY